MENFICSAKSASDLTNHDFNALCSVFESQIDIWTELYRAVHQITDHNSLDNDYQVSDAAKEDGVLAAFCFARLVELYQGDVRGDRARGIISQEVEITQEWDDKELDKSIEASFSTLATASNPTSLGTFSAGYNSCLRGIQTVNDSFGNTVIWRLVKDYYIPLVTIFTGVSFFAIIAALALKAVSFSFQYAKDPAVEALRQIPIVGPTVGPVASRLLGPSWFPTPGSVMSSSDFLVGVSNSLLNVTRAISNTTKAIWFNFQSLSLHPTPVINVSLPSIPFKEGILNASNYTIQLSEQTKNITVVPLLMSHALRIVSGAADTISVSPLRYKDQLKAKFITLELLMSKLVSLLQRYNNGVPRLFDRFAYNMAIAVDSSDSIRTGEMDLRKTPLIILLHTIGIWWLIPFVVPQYHAQIQSRVYAPIYPQAHAPFWLRNSFNVLGGSSLLMAMNLDTCIYNPGHLPEDFYCQYIRSILMEYTPGIGKHEDAKQKSRRRAVQSLETFFELLDDQISELYQITVDGSELCEQIQESFREIHKLGLTNMIEVERDLEDTDPTVDQGQNWIQSLFSTSGSKKLRAEERAKRNKARRERHYLDNLDRLHQLASNSFSTGKNILRVWKDELHLTLRDVHVIAAAAKTEAGFGKGSEDAEFWKGFKSSMDELRMVMVRLADANEEQKLWKRVNSLEWEERSRACWVQTRQTHGSGQQKRWDDCFFDGLVINPF